MQDRVIGKPVEYNQHFLQFCVVPLVAEMTQCNLLHCCRGLFFKLQVKPTTRSPPSKRYFDRGGPPGMRFQQSGPPKEGETEEKKHDSFE